MKKIFLAAMLAVCSMVAKAQLNPYDLVNYQSCDVIVYYYDHLANDCSWIAGPPAPPPTGTVSLPAGSPGSPTIMTPPPPPLGWERSYFVQFGTCTFGPLGNYGPPMCPGETVAIFPNLAGCNSECTSIGEIWANPGGWLGIY